MPYTYDSLGNLASSTDALGRKTLYTHGAFNRLTSLTDANGNTTTYAYDPSGNLLSTTYANGSAEHTTFDPLGNPLSFTNRRGQAVTFSYNAAGQVTKQTFPDNSHTDFTYDARGNLKTATDAAGTITFTYDAADRLTRVDYPGGQFLQFTLDGGGRRTRMVDQTGFTVNYTYDAAGRLSGLTDGDDALIAGYTYDAAGRLSWKDNGNGAYTTYDYDPNGNVEYLFNYAPDGSVNSWFHYTYNALGQRATMATADGAWAYAYDGTGQLTHAVFASTNPSIPDQDLRYGYDAVGNRTSTLLNGVPTAYTSNSLNQYTSVGGAAQTYDADGNLLSDGTNAYTYDVLGRLTSVTAPGGTTTYTYDALGNRSSTTTGGQVTRYLNDPTGLIRVVGESDGGGATVAHNTYGLGLASRATGGNTYYYDFDALGSTAGLTDGGGGYANSYRYLPFGGTLSSSGEVPNPFQFAGGLGVQAGAGGLEFMRARFYSPQQGRFLSQNPVGLYAGDANLYRYAANSPLQNAEPGGTPAALGNRAGAGLFRHGMAYVSIGATSPSDYLLSTPNTPRYTPEELAERQACAGYPGQGVAYRLPNGTGMISPFPGDFPRQKDSPSDTVPTPRLPGDPPAKPPGQLPGIPAEPVGGGTSRIVKSFDPNDMIGPAGFGSSNFVAADATLPYVINFENNPTASAPAQTVTITNQLSPDLDWSTFQITGMGFGDTLLSTPSSRVFQTAVPVLDGGESFNVHVDAGIQTDTGKVYVTFQSLNPSTSLPPGVLSGFLPAENGTGQGAGYISYTIRPRAGLPTGTVIRNVALITFDNNETISTDQVDPFDPTQGIDPNKQALVTIDAGLPTSTVAGLPAVTTTTSFPVSWSGSDPADGSGLAAFDVYVSVNGGEYTRWLTNTTDTSATFTGSFLSTYRFYSVAIDNAGNRQSTPDAAQAATQLLDPRGVSAAVTSNHPGGSTYGQSVTLTVTLTPQFAGSPTPTGTVQFQIDGTDFGSPVTLVNGAASLTTSLLGAGDRDVTVAYSGDGNYDPSTSAPFTQAVARATLTVTADDKTKVAGDAIPTLTARYSGFVNGENSSVLGGSPSLSAPGAAVNTAGTYAITPAAGSLTAANYSFQFVNGTLTVTPAAPAAVTAFAGTPQSATVGTAFAAPLKAVVTDVYGNPVPGVTVTFTAPAAGPTGTFAGGSATATAVTNSAGVAVAPAFTAGAATGTYSVTAGATLTTPATFTLTNLAPAVESVVVNGGDEQRSRVTEITVTFNTVVTIDDAAFVFQRVGTYNGDPGDNALVVAGFTTQVVGGTTVATLTFDGDNTEAGSLADGRWTLTVDRTKARTAGGIQMETDFVQPDITRLFGDIDGSGGVDFQDFQAFSQAYVSTEGDPEYDPAFDSDASGGIDFQDLQRFTQNYGLSL